MSDGPNKNIDYNAFIESSDNDGKFFWNCFDISMLLYYLNMIFTKWCYLYYILTAEDLAQSWAAMQTARSNSQLSASDSAPTLWQLTPDLGQTLLLTGPTNMSNPVSQAATNRPNAACPNTHWSFHQPPHHPCPQYHNKHDRSCSSPLPPEASCFNWGVDHWNQWYSYPQDQHKPSHALPEPVESGHEVLWPLASRKVGSCGEVKE